MTTKRTIRSEGESQMERDLLQIQEFLTLVSEVGELVASIGTEEDSPELRANLNLKRDKAMNLESKLSKRFKSKHSDFQIDQSAEHADRLVLSMQSIVDNFEQISLDWKSLYKESILKEIEVAKASKNVNIKKEENGKSQKKSASFNRRRSSSIEAPVPALMQSLHDPSLFMDQQQPISFQQVDQYNYTSREQIEQELLRVRSEKIVQLQTQMKNLLHFMQLTSKLIDEGGETVDTIEAGVQQMKENTDDAVINIAKTARQTPIISWPRTSAAAMLGIIGGVVAGPAGFALGVSSGVYMGEVVGQKLDTIAAEIVDKQVMMNEMVKEGNWASDESVHQCPACKSTFNALLRKHHCRVCGGIFCGYCSDKKVPLLRKGSDQPTMERSCNACYEKHHWQ